MKKFDLPLIGNENVRFFLLLLYLLSLVIFNKANAVATCVSCGAATTTINTNLSSSENKVGNTRVSNDVYSSKATYTTTAGQKSNGGQLIQEKVSLMRIQQL